MTDPPLGLLAELSHRCPLRCGYCSNPLELVRQREELDTKCWQSVLEQAAALGVLQVHLSGGEPTLRRDLEELIETAARVGLYTNLITAGVLLTRERVAALDAAGLDHVQLSVQDSRPETADEFAGYAGGHAKKLLVAGWIRERDIPLTLNAVVHRRNIDRVDELIALAGELDADRIEVANVQYHGWATQNVAALLPTREQLDRASAVVAREQVRLQGRLRIEFVPADYYAVRPKACMEGWGRRFLNVTPVGDVMPCHAAASIPGLVFENVKDRPLAEIWHASAAFERFRGTDWMQQPCRSCEFKSVDFGGCRCQALALAGDALKHDDRPQSPMVGGTAQTLLNEPS